MRRTQLLGGRRTVVLPAQSGLDCPEDRIDVCMGRVRARDMHGLAGVPFLQPKACLGDNTSAFSWCLLLSKVSRGFGDSSDSHVMPFGTRTMITKYR